MTVQMLEWAALQSHVDLVRRLAHILGGEMLFDMMIINMHRGMYRIPILFGNARATDFFPLVTI